jgi:glycopeptide antibiotics resistance protein
MLLPFSWGMFIFFMHSIPGYDLVYNDPWRLLSLDKLAHMALFSAFVVMLIVAFRKQVTFRTLRTSARLWAVGIAMVYGSSLEFFQGQYFMMRTTDPLDMAANTIGAVIGLLAFRIIYGPGHFSR